VAVTGRVLSLPNALGTTGPLFYVISMSMKTVIPLRITSIVSAACLLGSSILARSLPAILLYALLLPVHSFRLCAGTHQEGSRCSED
jgi:hypothetical protein